MYTLNSFASSSTSFCCFISEKKKEESKKACYNKALLMEMEKLNVSPQVADQTIIEGEGGAYYSWSPSKSPFLGEAKLGAGKLVLQPRGFALPHYTDSSKIGYVLHGNCTVGQISPKTSEERILLIEKGDVISVPFGVVSWWFNRGDSEVVIVFLGETTKAHAPGVITYSFLTGTGSILQGFSTEFISKAYDIDEEQSNKLKKSQTGSVIVRLEEGTIAMPYPSEDDNFGDKKINTSIEKKLPDIKVENGGSITRVTAKNMPILGEVGLSAKMVKLDGHAMLGPMFTTDSSHEIIYVVRGSGQVQIVGAEGQSVLDSKLQAGHLFMVPRFFAASVIADGEGMECFSVLTSSEPEFGQLAGNSSIWEALSPSVLQASLNVTPEFGKIFKSKIKNSAVIIPPKNLL